MGQEQKVQITATQVMTLTLAAGTHDSLHFQLTLDSSSHTSTAPVHLPDQARFLGGSVSGSMSVTGAIGASSASESLAGDEGTALADELKRFLPALHGFTSGTTWTDTVTINDGRNGGQVFRTSVSTYRIAGDTAVAGAPALQVRRTSAITIAGKGNAQGSDFEMAGGGTGEATFLVSRRGVYLGGVMSDSTTFTVTVPAQGLTIPTTRKRASKVEVSDKS